MNDKTSSPASKNPLRLNKETLKTLRTRSGLRTGANDTLAPATAPCTVVCTVGCAPPPDHGRTYGCMNQG